MGSAGLVDRVARVTGKPVATLFVEDGTDRHLVIELTLSAVALYLAGKYVDGFVKGLGIEDLGHKHGRALAKVISASDSMIREVIDEAEAKERLAREEAVVRVVIDDVSAHAADTDARSAGKDQVIGILVEKGLPGGEAVRLAGEIDVEVLGPDDG